MIIIDVGSADKHPAKMQPSGNASPWGRVWESLKFYIVLDSTDFYERCLCIKLFFRDYFVFFILKNKSKIYEFCFFFLFRCFKHLPNKSVTIHAPTGSTKKTHTHTSSKIIFSALSLTWFLSFILFLNAVINKRNDIMCVFRREILLI